MILWFYILWSIALLRVVIHPFSFFLRKAVWIMIIGSGAWLLIGALTYQTQYQLYLANKSDYEERHAVYLAEQAKLEELYQTHPTSRDVLLRLARTAAITGQREKLLEYVSALREVDPNHPEVKSLLHSLL